MTLTESKAITGGSPAHRDNDDVLGESPPPQVPNWGKTRLVGFAHSGHAERASDRPRILCEARPKPETEAEVR